MGCLRFRTELRDKVMVNNHDAPRVAEQRRAGLEPPIRPISAYLSFAAQIYNSSSTVPALMGYAGEMLFSARLEVGQTLRSIGGLSLQNASLMGMTALLLAAA